MSLALNDTPGVEAADIRRDTAGTLLPILAAAVVYVVVLAVGENLLNDPDTYWHIAAGDWILANGFPRADPFSFTFAGEPWIAKEWLSQVAYSLAFRAGGWSGVAVLAAVAFAASFGLLAGALRRNLATLPAIVCLCAAFVLAAPHAVARPHLLALPVMVAWVAGVVAALDRRRAPSSALLLLMILWANLHSSFLLGLVLLAAAALEAIVTAERQDRGRTFRQWALFGVAAVAAACVTPYGPETTIAALSVLGLGPALSLISEFRPADFSSLEAFEVVLLAAAGLALYGGVRLSPVRILVLLGLVHLALSATRYAEILGLLAPLYLAAPLAAQFPALRAPPAGGGPSRPAAAAIAVVVALLLAAATAAFAAYVRPEPSARTTPDAALAALRAADAGPILNDYDFGGYLIHAGMPTFIDGRAELYGAPFVIGYYRAVTLADLPGFLKLLDDYAIGATMLRSATPAVGWLDTQPGWRRLYGDDVAVVHVRAAP